MKNIHSNKTDYKYLVIWLTTYYITSVAWGFCSGMALTIIKFIFTEASMRNIAISVFGTVVVCSSLAAAFYRAGLHMNKTSVRVSVPVIIFNQIAAAVIFIAASVIFKNQYLLNPEMHNIAKVMYSGGDPYYSVRTDSFGKMIPIVLIQVLLYSAVSLGMFMLAKVKQNKKNEVTKILLEDRNALKQKAPELSPRSANGILSEQAELFEIAMNKQKDENQEENKENKSENTSDNANDENSSVRTFGRR